MVPNGPNGPCFGNDDCGAVSSKLMARPRRNPRWSISHIFKKFAHYTPDSFDKIESCAKCGAKHFECAKQLPTKHDYYRAYGYLCKRIVWRIRCGNKSCQTPLGVILKPEYWDSAL